MTWLFTLKNSHGIDPAQERRRVREASATIPLVAGYLAALDVWEDEGGSLGMLASDHPSQLLSMDAHQ